MSEPAVTSTSDNHSAPISKPKQDPHSVAHETVPPESRPVGREEHGTTGPDDKPPGAPEGEDYPPQKHAGAVGYGPHYAEVHGKETGFGAKLTGYKEQIKGKVTHNPELAQQGHDRVTGDLKAKQQAEEDAKSPFGNKEGEQGAANESMPAPPNAPNAASAEKPTTQ
ncbi:hypothetical protein FRC09_014249 [Ceratobasidium sp. 395]|nr:hypothetical protein FRC09_014249 [Ceratobasidium sp. 395]